MRQDKIIKESVSSLDNTKSYATK